jgi:hypothetical protein
MVSVDARKMRGNFPSVPFDRPLGPAHAKPPSAAPGHPIKNSSAESPDDVGFPSSEVNYICSGRF